jgi:malate permease and related proteins
MFLELLSKIYPIYITILLGFIAGRVYKLDGKPIASALFYIIAPVVFFNYIAKTHLTMQTASLPILVFIIAFCVCIGAYLFGKAIFKDKRANIFALMSATANSGYFGFPIALMLFGEEVGGMYLLAMMGTTFAESTICFYIAASGNYSARDALFKLLKLPNLHALILGCFFSLAHITLPHTMDGFMANMKATYSILGVFIVGLLASSGIKHIDVKYTFWAICMKWVVYPLIALAIVFIDKNYIHFFTPVHHQILILLCIMPLPGNGPIIAEILGLFPQKNAIAVLLNIILAVIYIPIMIILLNLGNL